MDVCLVGMTQISSDLLQQPHANTLGHTQLLLFCDPIFLKKNLYLLIEKCLTHQRLTVTAI